jgi:uncharacterized membrane protein YozB (DUF420 family)
VKLVGIFNAGAPFVSDLNLILQVVIAAFLVLALLAIVRKRYAIHGTIMGCCLVLNTISIFAVMIPSLLGLDGLISGLSTRLSLLVVMHGAVGSVVEVLGFSLVVAWVFSGTRIANCFRRKRLMEATIVLWILELFLGVYVYMTLYPLA